MLHRRGPVIGAEVIDRLVGEVPIFNVKRAGLNLAEKLIPKVERNDQEGRDGAEKQHEQRRRQDSPRATSPETG